MSIISAYQLLVFHFLERNDAEGIFLIKGQLRYLPQPLIDQITRAVRGNTAILTGIRSEFVAPATIFHSFGLGVYQWQALCLIHICQRADAQARDLFQHLLGTLGYSYEQVFQLSLILMVQSGGSAEFEFLLKCDGHRLSTDFTLMNGQTFMDLTISSHRPDLLSILLRRGAVCNEKTVSLAAWHSPVCYKVFQKLRPRLCSSERVRSWLGV